MSEFLNTAGINRKLEDLIKGAKNNLVFISPYLQISPLLIEAIQDAESRGVKMRLLYGKGPLKKEAKENLRRLAKIDIYYLQNLHAKCYFNDNQMIITSMNLHEVSQKNNDEMGIAIDGFKDEELFEQGLAEANRLFLAATYKPLIKIPEIKEDYSMKVAKLFAPELLVRGYCIGCRRDLAQNVSKPICENCFSSFNHHSKIDSDRFCHSCGKVAETTKDRPKCYSCYSKIARATYRRSDF